jgi:5-carboxyvanillate decarboxylase
MSSIGRAPYKRIATEEAFATQEQFRLYGKLLDSGWRDPGFESLWGFYLRSEAERPRLIRARLLDLDSRRIGDMDDTGIDVQVLSLTSPGVNVLEADEAKALSVSSNDEVAAAVSRHPGRYAALAAFAPQAPEHAAQEIERAVTKLGLKGAIFNGHTRGEWLDDQKFWAIFEACEALDVPIYLHPTGPHRDLIQPMLERGLDGAVYGFGVDTGLHALRLMVAGLFDRFPKLKFVLGHLGEALPFWVYRLDYMSIRLCQEVLGVDRVLYAMDYPYQFVAEEVTLQDNLAVSPEVKTQFFQTNAERLFGLHAKGAGSSG